MYTGEVEIAACADGETRLSGEMEIEVTHSVAMGTRAGKRFLPFLLMLVALGVCYRLMQRF